MINQSEWYHWCSVDRTIWHILNTCYIFVTNLPCSVLNSDCQTDTGSVSLTFWTTERRTRTSLDIRPNFSSTSCTSPRRQTPAIRRPWNDTASRTWWTASGVRRPVVTRTRPARGWSNTTNSARTTAPVIRWSPQHFDPVRNFLDEAYESGGRALVHCKAGVNRSATLCVAYMMLKKNMTLLKAAAVAKRKRVYVLSNRGFRQQLIDFAKNNDLVIEKNGKSNRNRHARDSY